MTVGAVLSDTWALYKRLFLRTFAVGGLVFLLIELVEAGAGGGRSLPLALFALALALVGTAFVQGALVEVVRDVHEGEQEPRLSATYERAAPQLGALVAVSLLAGLGIGVGLLILIVPGVVLAVRWSLVVPVVILEEASTRAAFGRSSELVRGHGWAVFRVLLNVALISAALGLGISFAIVQALPSHAFLSLWLGGALGGAIATPYAAHAMTVVYYRLTEPDKPMIPEARLR